MHVHETTDIEIHATSRPRRRPSPQIDDEPSMEDAMRQVRVVVRTMLGGRTIEQSAGLADVSSNTLTRILRGENLTVATFAKIVCRLGGRVVIRVER